MPATLETRENGRVQYYKLTDPLSLRELTNLYTDDNNYRNSVDFTVHTHYDLTDLKHLPSGVLGTRLGAPPLDHPRSGQIVLTGAIPLAQAIGEMITRLTRLKQNKVKFFRTLDEGWEYLHKHMQEVSDEVSTS